MYQILAIVRENCFYTRILLKVAPHEIQCTFVAFEKTEYCISLDSFLTHVIDTKDQEEPKNL